MTMLHPYEISKKYKIGIQTVRRWLRTGKLKGVRINKRGDFRISQESLDAYLKELNET